MRFFEFKDNENIEKDLEKLSKLSDQDPSLKKTVVDGLRKILSKIDNSLSSDNIEVKEAEEEDARSLIAVLVDRLDNFDLDPADRLRVKGEIANLTLKTEKEAAAKGFQTALALSQETTTNKLEKAKKIAQKVGKTEDWAVELLSRLDRYKDDRLINDFMDLVIEKNALTSNIITDSPVSKPNLRNLLNPKIVGILDDKKAFEKIVQIPFSEQTVGFGGGIGPGEGLFAMLIPDAMKAPGASDLKIGKEIWEVKGGGSDTSKAWLDSASIAPAQLRDIFNKGTESLKPKFRTKITYKDGNVYTLSQVLDLADFRDEKFRFLRTAFNRLDDSARKFIIKEMYELLFPNVKKNDNTFFNKNVRDSIKFILEGDRKSIADIQVKLALLEYSLGSYQANNFIIYNYLNNDLIVIRGKEGIINAIDKKENMVKTETITMGNAKKSSPGVTLLTKPGKRKPKIYD
jgi:hypothetical protein